MDNLMTTTEMVKELLQTRPETRNSDDILYYHVCAKINPICVNYPFCQIIQNRKAYGFPAFESVRRTRQKIQRSYPELAAVDKVEGFRAVNEAKYRDYARKVMV